MLNRALIIAVLAMIVLVAGCSSGSGVNPVTPNEQARDVTADDSRQLWGMWQFTADPAAGTLDVVPLRGVAMHINALPFLEPPPLVNLTLESLVFNGNIIEADIGLRHPFLGLTEFSGFDVCGILITRGNVTGYSDPDLVMAGDGDTRLLNPDGYSRWWNPAEFPVNTGTMFGYNDGILGTPDAVGDYNSTLNAYKYFCDDLDNPDDPLDLVTIESRGLFSAGQKNIRHYTIELGNEGLVFNYAVDACWQFPDGNYPWEAPDDFGPDSNRPEPWRINITELANTLYNDGLVFGGGISILIDVYDHFNADMNNVRVESPFEVPMTESATAIGGGEGYSTYQVDIPDCTPAASGDLELLVTIESDVVDYGGNLPGEPVSAYFTYHTVVSDTPPVTSPWSDEFEIIGSGGRFPVIAQAPSGRVVAAWSQNPGVHWAEFTFPDSWGEPGVVALQYWRTSPPPAQWVNIDAIRMSIEPGFSGDDIIITTQTFGGTMYINGVLTEYGHPLLYKWEGSTTWDDWDTRFISYQLMHHTMVDFQGKYQWFWGTRSAYGHPMHVQFSNWEQDDWYDWPYPAYWSFGYPNCSELGYSRCWDDDSSGNAYMVYEWDLMKGIYLPPSDFRGLALCVQPLPSMTGSTTAFIIEATSNDYCDSPSLAINSNDRIYVAYRRYIDSTGLWQIVLRWSDGGTSWSPTNEDIVWSGSLEPEWRYVSLDIDSQDRLHITFKVDKEIWYTRSTDGTDWIDFEWVNESIDDLLGVADLEQWMFVDEDDQVHVIWARIPVGPGNEYGSLRHRWRQP